MSKINHVEFIKDTESFHFVCQTQRAYVDYAIYFDEGEMYIEVDICENDGTERYGTDPAGLWDIDGLIRLYGVRREFHIWKKLRKA